MKTFPTKNVLGQISWAIVKSQFTQLQTLREEYLTRLEKARSEIERRVAYLRSQKQSQAASLDRLAKHELGCDRVYRVTHLLADLGWVDFDLECSTGCWAVLQL